MEAHCRCVLLLFLVVATHPIHAPPLPLDLIMGDRHFFTLSLFTPVTHLGLLRGCHGKAKSDFLYPLHACVSAQPPFSLALLQVGLVWLLVRPTAPSHSAR
ncbi:hypothetical protein QBC36DRAFT_78655 [Triangularia setosa]|uniref:Secreted protein n=1 Tax=Triangularia setosa TaxID=2587417 RepID=A0AAN7A9Q1_9PEZI|nr:hypothetical protein QBC36DRAFT_78655 [Podospora setosa]